MWLTVCRNFNILKDSRKTMSEIFNICDDSGTRNHDLDDAINEWRICLRENEYFY